MSLCASVGLLAECANWWLTPDTKNCSLVTSEILNLSGTVELHTTKAL